MTTDISRKTFNPNRNAAWTTTMQGRVATDAPQNEDRRIRDRRLRAGMVDLIGRCGYPQAMPDAFRITVSAGALMIGAGRYYVDAHLAENFGLGGPDFDPILSEDRGPDPVPFADQPYLPGITPDPPEDGRHLVYLDVWQRDVISLQDETILDPAIPVDTFARRQTVWQVKSFGPLADGVTCETPDADIDGWPAEIAPSAARLTTRANPAQALTNPCLLPPGAEYRGIDNRTYSYVIHDFAADGTPLVKFSRSHGVIATTILSQPQADTLEVVDVAKDDFLRFNAGDWVEITDEVRVLSEEPGVITRILSVDDPSNAITLEDPLPPGTLRLDGPGPDLDQEYHPIIRRWDQSGQIRDTGGVLIVDLDLPGSNGLIPVPADGTFIALEDGVEAALSLDPVGGIPRIGDSWTFIARYADNSVEELDAAPPEDTHHHYCRLALVDAAGGVWLDPPVSDCRDPIDLGGDCCCTVIIHPGDDIQAGIDSLPPDFGGCVCLKSGLHEIDTAIVISTPNITLHGESHGAILRRRNDGPVLQIRQTRGIDVHSVQFEHRSATGADGLVEILSASDVHVSDCGMRAVRGTLSSGIVIADGSDVAIIGNRIEEVVIGVAMPARCDHIRIADNVMALGGDQFVGQLGVTARDARGPISVSGNRISGALTGVSLNDDPTGAGRGSLAVGSLVADNRITLALRSADPADEVVWFGIDTAADDTTIRGNSVDLTGSARAGIRTSGAGVRVLGNTVNADAVADDDARNIGIFVGNTADQSDLTEQITVSGNALRSITTGVSVRDASDVLVSGNEIDPTPTIDFQPGIALNQAIATRVTDNAIRGAGSGIVAIQGRFLRVTGNTIANTGFGIGIGQDLAPTVSNNSITNAALFGVMALATIARTSFTENHVSNSGWIGGLPFGLGALLVLGEWHVEANEVMNIGVPIDGNTNANRTLGITGVYVMESRIESNLVTYSAPQLLPDGREDRALLMQGLLQIIVGDTLSFGFPCQVTNNKFIGKGNSALVEIRDQPLNDNINLRFERIFFNNNYCNHVGPVVEAPNNATVLLEGSAGVVMGNQIIEQSRIIASVNMGNMQGTMVGNITSSGFINDPDFPTPEADFNRQI